MDSPKKAKTLIRQKVDFLSKKVVTCESDESNDSSSSSSSSSSSASVGAEDTGPPKSGPSVADESKSIPAKEPVPNVRTHSLEDVSPEEYSMYKKHSDLLTIIDKTKKQYGGELGSSTSRYAFNYGRSDFSQPSTSRYEYPIFQNDNTLRWNLLTPLRYEASSMRNFIPPNSRLFQPSSSRYEPSTFNKESSQPPVSGLNSSSINNENNARMTQPSASRYEPSILSSEGSASLNQPLTSRYDPSTLNNESSTRLNHPSTSTFDPSKLNDDSARLNQPSTSRDDPSTLNNESNTRLNHPSTSTSDPSKLNDGSARLNQPSTSRYDPSTSNNESSTRLNQPSTSRYDPSTLNDGSARLNQPSTSRYDPSTLSDGSARLNQPSTSTYDPSTFNDERSSPIYQPSTSQSDTRSHLNQPFSSRGPPNPMYRVPNEETVNQINPNYLFELFAQFLRANYGFVQTGFKRSYPESEFDPPPAPQLKIPTMEGRFYYPRYSNPAIPSETVPRKETSSDFAKGYAEGVKRTETYWDYLLYKEVGRTQHVVLPTRVIMLIYNHIKTSSPKFDLKSLLMLLTYLGSERSTFEEMMRIYKFNTEKEVQDDLISTVQAILPLRQYCQCIWPTEEEKVVIDRAFCKRYSLPGIIGVLGTKTIKSIVPGEHDILIQAVVDHDLRYRDFHISGSGTLLSNFNHWKLSERLTKYDTTRGRFVISPTYCPLLSQLVPENSEKNLANHEIKFNEVQKKIIEETVDVALANTLLKFPKINYMGNQFLDFIASSLILQNFDRGKDQYFWLYKSTAAS